MFDIDRRGELQVYEKQNKCEKKGLHRRRKQIKGNILLAA